jgi:hypothetical protein
MKQPQKSPQDPALAMALIAAETVCPDMLPGARGKARDACIAQMRELLVRYAASRPVVPGETLWIGMQSLAPALAPWPGQPRAVKLAIETFRDVLLAMDRGLAPEPPPPPAQKPLPKMPGRHALVLRKPMRSIFDIK